MTIENIKEFLLNVASRPAWEFENNELVDDYAAGNVDDAFEGGYNCGQVQMARLMLKLMEL